MSHRKALTDFVQREFSSFHGQEMPQPDDSLLKSAGGIVDSLGLQKLITFIEDDLHVEVRDEDIVPETFETLNRLIDYVDSRSSQMPSPNTPHRPQK